jgi:hypothetical protein
MSKDWHRGKYPPTLIEALMTHNLLFNLGYSPKEEIFLEVTGQDVGVILKAEGKEASFRMGAPELPPQEMKQLWTELVLAWNTGGSFSKEEKDALWQASKVRPRAIEVAMSLIMEGFTRVPADRAKLRSLQ